MAGMNRVEWEEGLYDLLCEFLECSRGDAQGVVEARQDEVDAAFARGETPRAVAGVLTGIVDDEAPVPDAAADLIARAEEALSGGLARETVADLLREAVEALREVGATPTYQRLRDGSELIIRPFPAFGVER